jgi:hypothetical protein
MEWKSMPDGKEKYNAYLCSREWSVLKEAVKERSRGVCERCNANQMDHVHHLTYIRKYRERIEDLRAMCKGCHDFTHGKSDYDPAIYGYGRIAGKFVGTFYLAGKITGTDWRDEIVRDWSQENHSPHNYEAMYEYEKSKLWAVAHRAASAGNGVMLDYVGPWWAPEGTLLLFGLIRLTHTCVPRMKTGKTRRLLICTTRCGPTLMSP